MYGAYLGALTILLADILFYLFFGAKLNAPRFRYADRPKTYYLEIKERCYCRTNCKRNIRLWGFVTG